MAWQAPHRGNAYNEKLLPHHVKWLVQMLNVDLHCHSTVSDGALAPAELAARAKRNGVDIWALTDHDEVGGVAQARAAALDLGLEYVPGVEISVSWAGRTLHIVGLHINENNEPLVRGLAHTRAGRELRARAIAAQLEAVGIPDAFEGALELAGNPNLLSRTHFARFLVGRGICADVGEVFRNYLIQGKPGYVPHRWASLQDAVGWIRGAGGMAVIAHPGRYKLDAIAFDALFDEFRRLGGSGIEVVTGSHAVEQYGEFAHLARQYGFLASRGSDFHAPGESRFDLGALPHLPDNVVPIWQDWLR